MDFIALLQVKGCAVSHRGHLEMPFIATAQSLARSKDQVKAKAAARLDKYVRLAGLRVSKGTIGETKIVVLRSGDVKICKLVVSKAGGYQFKPTNNWTKAKKIKRVEVKAGMRESKEERKARKARKAAKRLIGGAPDAKAHTKKFTLDLLSRRALLKKQNNRLH